MKIFPPIVFAVTSSTSDIEEQYQKNGSMHRQRNLHEMTRSKIIALVVQVMQALGKLILWEGKLRMVTLYLL